MKKNLLKHLSKRQLNELIERYYGKEKITDLIIAFGLNINASKLVGEFPPKVLKNLKCKYCNIPMTQRYASRSASTLNQPEPVCSSCKHSESNKCTCNRCEEARKKHSEYLESSYRKRIVNIQRGNIGLDRLDDISIKHAVYLVGLCRHTRYDESDVLSPMILHRLSELSPTPILNKIILKTLYLEKFIEVSESTEYGIIEFQYKKFDFDLNWYKVEWRVNFSRSTVKNISYIHHLEKMLASKDLWPSLWHSELLEIWGELSLHECLRYLHFQLEKYDFQQIAGEKTISVISSSLKNYSVRQCYYFIWVSVKNSVAYYVEKNISKRQAANGVIGQVQRKVERSLAEQWQDIKNYNKTVFSGTSILSSLFAHVITDLGDDFLLIPPVNLNK